MNGSIRINEFTMLGFSVPQWSRAPLSFCFIFLYVFIICVNALIIVLVKTEAKLQTPMYFFIANFSFLEVWYTTVTVPRMIQDLMLCGTSISFIACITQFYCFMICGANEHCLLAVLSYDRFIAICHPLRYRTVMKPNSCVCMIISTWFISLVIPISTAFSFFKAKYCDAKIDHFFCDISPLLQISCSDNTQAAIVFYTLATVLILGCLSMICISYTFILYTVLRVNSHQGRNHAFSTCASHLTVVTIFYSSCIFMYIRLPSYQKLTQADKLVALAYVLAAPVLNPMIYAFRNKAIKAAIRKKLTF